MARCTGRTEGKCLTVKEVRRDASGLKGRVLSEVEPARIPVFSPIPHFGESAPSSLGGTSEGLSPFHLDETPCNAFAPSVEITPARWSRFAERASIDPGLDPMTVLENLHLVKDTGMTHTGAWLLADDITRFTVQAGITCAVFRGSAKTHILDRKEFKGNLYDIYLEVMTYFQAKLNSASFQTPREETSGWNCQ